MTAHTALIGVVTQPNSALALRWGSAGLIAGVITLGLFLLMRLLIHVEIITLPDPGARVAVTISEYVEPIDPLPRTPPERVEFEPSPPAPVLNHDREGQPDENGLTFASPPPIDRGDVVDSMDIGVIAPPPLIVRTPPVYPAREQERGITGSCIIEYDILASGETANLRALACDSRGFETAALQAVSGWRYQAVQGRNPDDVVQRRLQTNLVFELD